MLARDSSFFFFLAVLCKILAPRPGIEPAPPELEAWSLFFLFLAALGLLCCARAFSSCGEWRLLFVAVHGLLTVVASLVAEHRLYGAQASVAVARGLQQLWHTGSVVVVRGL